MRARLVLLDADVVIEAMRVGAWDKLIEQVEVWMTPTVRDQVTHEKDPVTGQKHTIDMTRYAGRVKLIEEDGDALVQVQEACRKHVSLHHGELESLACLPKLDADCRFCTGDSAAIKALALLGMPERAASLERVLSDNGVPGSGKIDDHFRDAFLQMWLHKGLEIRAQNVELG